LTLQNLFLDEINKCCPICITNCCDHIDGSIANFKAQGFEVLTVQKRRKKWIKFGAEDTYLLSLSLSLII